MVSEFITESCDTIGKEEFEQLSKSEKKEWTVSRDQIINKFNQWINDNNEPSPKRGFLVKRLESLGYTGRKSNGEMYSID